VLVIEEGHGHQSLGLSSFVVVLVEPESPGNVGFTARAMANFGVTSLRIVGADPRQESQARIFAVHATEILDNAEIFDDLEAAISDTEGAWAATARSGSNHSVTRAVVPVNELPDPTTRKARVALVFGRESSGLTNEEIGLCDLSFIIPTSEQYSSMNLSHAAAVTLYELYSKYAERPPRRATDIRPATRAEREQAAVFFDALVDMASIKDFRKPIAKQVFRNLIHRAFMSGREITTLTGTIRKIAVLAGLVADED
jgi:tRNA/rRNA methyltransferase